MTIHKRHDGLLIRCNFCDTTVQTIASTPDAAHKSIRAKGWASRAALGKTFATRFSHACPKHKDQLPTHTGTYRSAITDSPLSMARTPREE